MTQKKIIPRSDCVPVSLFEHVEKLVRAGKGVTDPEFVALLKGTEEWKKKILKMAIQVDEKMIEEENKKCLGKS